MNWVLCLLLWNVSAASERRHAFRGAQFVHVRLAPGDEWSAEVEPTTFQPDALVLALKVQCISIETSFLALT